jgi:ankyrin repeat protein
MRAMKTPTEVLAENGCFPTLSSQSRDAFLRACKDGPTEVVRAYLDLGMPVDSRVDISLETALIKAAEGGSIERLELLLERGADQTLIDSSGDTALRTALNWSHPEAARYLAQKGSDLTAVNRWGESALLHAIEKSQPDNVALLLELGADPNFIGGEYARSAPRKAIENQDEATLRALLDHKLDPNLTLDPQGARPLFYAIRHSATALIELLLARGADPYAQDHHGTSALDYATTRGNWMVAALGDEALDDDKCARAEKKARVWSAAASGDFDAALAAIRDADLSVDSFDGDGKTLLVHAVESGSIDAVRAVLDAGASADLANPWGSNALAWVKEETSDEVVALLIARGARAMERSGKPLLIHRAVWNEREPQLRLLLSTVTSFEDKHWGELMSAAVMKKNVAIVRALHEAGCPLNVHAEIGGETPLHGACTAYRSDEVIAYLLANGADVNATNGQGFTPLHSAVQHYAYDDTYIDVLRALVQGGARWDSVDEYTRTPFECARDTSKQHVVQLVVDEPIESGKSIDELAAAQSWATLAIWYDAGRRDEVFSFVARGASIEPPPSVKASPLLQAAIEKQDVELVRALLQRGADAKRAGHYGTTMLHVACEAGSVELCELLVQNGASLDAADDWGTRPVHTAAKSVDVLRWALERGADATSGAVSTPLMTAVAVGQAECVRILLERGATANATDSYTGATIFKAIEIGNVEIVDLLLRAGTSTTVLATQTGDTPLTAAAKTGNVAIVRALLERGADELQKNRDGEDALTFLAARKELRREFADVLTRHGVDTSAPSNVERLPDEIIAPSPWFAAVYSGDRAALAFMLASGHAVDERDAFGATALMYAVDAANVELAELLVDAGADVRAKDHENNSVSGYASFQSDAQIDAMLEAKAGAKLLSMDVLNERAGRSMVSTDVRKMLERGELKKLTAMLREKKLRPFTTVGGRSLVNIAIAVGDSDLLDFLLSLGLSVASADLRGELPLLTALQRGDNDTAEALLTKGASVDAKINGASLVAKMLGDYNESAAQWLIEHGADATGEDAMGRNAVMITAINGQPDLGVALLARHPELANAKDTEQLTALHRAVENWWGSQAIARALIDAGADVNAFDGAGRTPLHVALETYGEDPARLLLEKGASWDFVAPGIEEARSARAIAEDYGIDPQTWPGDGSSQGDVGDGAIDDANIDDE